MGDFTDIIDKIPEFGDAFLKETFIDPKTGIEIFCMTPASGTPLSFVSIITLHTTMGPMQLAFDVPGVDVAEACKNWQAAARDAVRKAGEQAKANQQRIVLPNRDVPPLPMKRKFGLPHA